MILNLTLSRAIKFKLLYSSNIFKACRCTGRACLMKIKQYVTISFCEILFLSFVKGLVDLQMALFDKKS